MKLDSLDNERPIVNLLREEYFDLLPDIRRVVWQLETEIRYLTLPILHSLKRHEQLVVKSRIKECESAVKTLRKQEGRFFDPEKPGGYSLLDLPDLAGVRVLVFPNSKLVEVDNALHEHFREWTYKPVKDGNTVLAPKYYGFCDEVSSKVRGEYQIVPMLIGLFWDVEHSAMYKSRGAANSGEMKKYRADVYDALFRFEEGIETFEQTYTEPPSNASTQV
jgi:ppGpp synthetase/RelA/SpoT-type nucleotidyltranferase